MVNNKARTTKETAMGNLTERDGNDHIGPQESPEQEKRAVLELAMDMARGRLDDAEYAMILGGVSARDLSELKDAATETLTALDTFDAAHPALTEQCQAGRDATADRNVQSALNR